MIETMFVVYSLLPTAWTVEGYPYDTQRMDQHFQGLEDDFDFGYCALFRM